MKQIDIIKTYSQKRCLIVDDVPDVRAQLKRILVDFGCAEVDTAGNAEEAIDLCERHGYDIVLADYNLGSGKNGQQLLEELRFNGLLKNTSLFVMITAESTSHYVLHALENQPDDYLNKPINKDGLRPRLDQALLKNEALLPVKKALDNKKPSAAIAACRALISQNNRYHNDARRVLGELLAQQHKFAEAERLYLSLVGERRPLWAQVGLARALFGQKKLAAEKLLLDIIGEHHYCVEAYDLLARIHEHNNKLEQAQHLLENAVKISPRSANRQRELGRVSRQLGDNSAASTAFRKAIKHSRNSCQESAEDYANLAHSLSRQIDGGENAAALAKEAHDALTQLDKRFASQPVVTMRRRLVEADLLDAEGKHSMAERACQAALDTFANLRFSVIENTSTQLCIDCARAFMDRGKYDEGERLLQELARLNRDPQLAIKIDKLLREPVTQEGIQYATKLNKQGIEHYRRNAVDAAIVAFTQVLHELPNHIGLNLNLIQALVSKSKERELSEKELALMESCFQRVGEIGGASSYAERYSYLQKRFERLRAPVSP